MYDISDDILHERYQLAIDRIREIKNEETVALPWRDFFQRTAEFILFMDQVRQDLTDGTFEKSDLRTRRTVNARMYEDILPENYDRSYANPDYATDRLGKAFGRELCFVYTQIRGIIGYIFEDLPEETVIHLELFLEVYGAFQDRSAPDAKQLREIIYWFASDYTDVLVAERIRQSVDPARDFAVRIVMDGELDTPEYLFDYGEYVTDNEIMLAQYLAARDESEIERMAKTVCDGYRTGFEKAGIDLEEKLTVNLHYHLGFERVVRKMIGIFDEMGLRPIIFRYALSAVTRRDVARHGYTGAIANPQYDYDHREDAALFLDKRFAGRWLSVMEHTYEIFRTLAGANAGPAMIETFGETPFEPENKETACAFSEKQQGLLVEMNRTASVLTNRYMKGDERSFTVIAFPVPEIGERFEEIFADTLRINTLDALVYEKIHTEMIKVLDHGREVHILGSGDNRTDLTVALRPLEDPFRETDFENCLADVNIPLGEVFTSPQLEGTNGILHVKRAYLEGLQYEDLYIEFRDGMISGYGCANFEDAAQGAAFVKASVLHHHETLPMGEFAIGTNTDAYMMACRYDIGARLPVLIAEKTGPHFAVGDTCYSWAEDIVVYNPDGKECVAKENSISALRREDQSKAYFNCHTDITIPYEELGLIEVIDHEGNAVPIIRDGRFVLPGTEELNRALDA